MTDPYSILRAGSEPPPPPRTTPLTSEPTVAIVGTGVYTLVSIYLSVQGLLLDNRVIPYSEAFFAISTFALLVGGVTGYVCLCLWMQAVQSSLKAARYDPPPSWKIWAGWLIPLYSLVAPLLVMRDLRARVVWGGGGVLGVWWAAFLGANVVDRIYAVTYDVNAFTNALLIGSALLIVVSYLALVKLILQISESLAPRSF